MVALDSRFLGGRGEGGWVLVGGGFFSFEIDGGEGGIDGCFFLCAL